MTKRPRGGFVTGPVGFATRPRASYPNIVLSLSSFSDDCVFMRRVLIVTAVVLCVGLSSCQCAEKPDVGPVEGEDEQASVERPPASPSAVSLPRA